MPMKLRRLNKIKPSEKETDGITLERFFEVFEDFITVKKLEGASVRTISDYSDHIKNYFKRFLEDERIEETEQLNISLIRNYMGYMQDRGLKSSTINIRLRTLRSFIRWMNREEIIDSSISVKLKLVKQEEKKIQIITDLQVKKFFNVIDTSRYTGFRDYILASLMLETGVRCNEAVNLKLADIDINRRLIVIGSDTAKTRRERHLPISKSLRRHLKELVEITRNTDCDYIFQRQTTGGITTNHVRKTFSEYGKLAKIKTPVTPHILRHTFASNFIKKGGDVFTLSTILGHTSINMSRRYVNLNSDEVRKIYDKFYD